MATPSAATVANACAVVDVIRSEAINQLLKLQQRFFALQRSVILLRGFVNNTVLPVFPNLPAMLTLDTNAYNQIRSACPGLSLPVLDTNAVGNLAGISQLEQMRVKYQQAVSSTLDKLERHPLSMIDQMQTALNTQIDAVLQAVGPFNQFVTCACAITSQIDSPTDADNANSFYDQLVNHRPTLVDQELSGQLNSFREAKLNLQKAVS